MRIIAGGTGLVGRHLAENWLAQGKQVMVVGRDRATIKKVFADRVQAETWQTLTPDMLKAAEVVVNLAGANIGERRWTAARKAEIMASRVESTRQLAQQLARLGTEAPPLFNASAIGVYGLQANDGRALDKPFDEESMRDAVPPTDFLADVARQWEQATEVAQQQGVRVVLLRFGVVLAKDGGALPQLLLPFRLYVGGKLGTGHQPFSWIVIDDLIRAINFLLAKKEVSGPVNCVAPNPVSQFTLTQAIAETMHKPALFRMPAFALELMLGKEMAQCLLLRGQAVMPRKLMAWGFIFNYPTITAALEYLLAPS